MTLQALHAPAWQALQAGDPETACALLRAAALAQPAPGTPLLPFAQALWDLYDFPGALEVCAAAHARDPGDPAICLFAARRLFSVGRFVECGRWLESAGRLSPEDPAVLIMRGEVFDRANEPGRAIECAEAALRLAPRFPRGVRLRAHLDRRAGRWEAARSRLESHLVATRDPDDWRVRYELAAVLDRLGDYEGAMRELMAAKSQLAPGARIHLAEARRVRTRQWEVLQSLTPEDLRGWSHGEESRRAPRPVAFLCGHPRCGTTLLEQIIGAHPGAVTTDETGVLNREFVKPMLHDAGSTRACLEELRGLDADSLAAGRSMYLRCTEAHLGGPVGNRVLIEKDPLLTPDLALPLRLFSEARIIFPLRDPRDVCLSFFFTLVPLNGVSAAAVDLGATIEFCLHSLRCWTRWKELLAQPWLESRYESLVADPSGQSRRLLEFLGLDWRPDVLRFYERSGARGVRTPTYADVAEPVYQRSVGRWRHYRRWFEPHVAALAPALRSFGYD